MQILSIDSYESSDHDKKYYSEPAKTLTNSIQIGLESQKCFSIYLPSKNKKIDGVIIRFTIDNKLILGLSVDDEDEKEENLIYAQQLKEILIKNYNCQISYIAVEDPPPDNEKEFLRKVKSWSKLIAIGTQTS